MTTRTSLEIRYYSAYRVNGDQRVWQVDDYHYEYGYWRFSGALDDTRARALGFTTPEDVLLAQDRDIEKSTYDGIWLQWVPGTYDGDLQMRNAPAAAHLRMIYSERRRRGMTCSFGGGVPTYHGILRGGADSCWGCTCARGETQENKGTSLIDPYLEDQSTGSFAMPRDTTPVTQENSEHIGCNASTEPVDRIHSEQTSNMAGAVTSLGHHSCPRVFMLGHQSSTTPQPPHHVQGPSRRINPPSHHPQSVPSSRQNLSQVKDSYSKEVMRQSYPRLTRSFQPTTKSLPRQASILSHNFETAPKTLNSDSNQSYLSPYSTPSSSRPPSRLSNRGVSPTHRLIDDLFPRLQMSQAAQLSNSQISISVPLSHDALEKVAAVHGVLESSIESESELQGSPLRHRRTEHIQPTNFSNATEHIRYPILDDEEEEVQQSNNILLVAQDPLRPLETPERAHTTSPKNTSPKPELKFTAVNSSERQIYNTAEGCDALKVTPCNSMPSSPAADFASRSSPAQPPQAPQTPRQLTLQESVSKNSSSPKTKRRPRSSKKKWDDFSWDNFSKLPCVGCGLVNTHIIDCGSYMALPSPNLTVLHIRALVDAVERFDPEQWREDYPGSPMPEPEDPEEVIRGLAEVIRGEESYESDPSLHGLGDEAMVLVWACKGISGAEVEILDEIDEMMEEILLIDDPIDLA